MRFSICCLLGCAGLAAQSIQQLEAAARAHLAARNANAALDDYQRLAALNPNSASYEDEIGFLLAATNRVAEAIPHLEKATALDPKLSAAWYREVIRQGRIV